MMVIYPWFTVAIQGQTGLQGGVCLADVQLSFPVIFQAASSVLAIFPLIKIESLTPNMLLLFRMLFPTPVVIIQSEISTSNLTTVAFLAGGGAA